MFLFSDSYYFQETMQLLQTGTPLLAWSISKFLSPKKPFKNYHLLICCSFFSFRATLIEFHLTGCLQIVSTTLTWDNELSYQKWWWRLSHNREALMKRSTGKRPARPTSTGRKGPPPAPRGEPPGTHWPADCEALGIVAWSEALRPQYLCEVRTHEKFRFRAWS